jgi:serine/threonine-protein kinase
MSTKIGHFEILSELSNSATGAVYKANDPQSGQTVALKAIQLSAFGDRAAELERCLLEEAEKTKVLSHSNLSPVFGAGEIDGRFCATMEYIQGNSIATMLARKEGFSIWDLLDIGRQVCSGLDHANSHNVFHFSLEPAKIMCGWDGTVRVLGYGVSSVGKFTAWMPGLPSVLFYMSPEQVHGAAIDERSNIFSLGAIFYEMVTDRKAFDREDPVSLRESILESTPVPPMHVNPKLQPGLSDLIMKALAKNPAERYQNGRELLDDLEKCKESKAKQPVIGAALAAQSAAPPDAVKAATQAKFLGASTPAQASKPQPASAQARSVPPPVAKTAPANLVQNGPVVNRPPEMKITASSVPAKAAAAAASGGGQLSATARHASAPPPSASMAWLDTPESEVDSAVETPKITVDPLMAENAPARENSVRFSEMTELPPLKEIYVAPQPLPPAINPAAAPAHTTYEEAEPERPKLQPREVAQKAVNEIKNVPPRLMIYSIAGAAVVILIIAVALVMHINSLNSEGQSPISPSSDAVQTASSQPVATAQPPAPASAPVPQAQSANPGPQTESQPAHTTSKGKSVNKKKPVAVPLPAPAMPGQMAIDSTPQGAQVQIDGKSDPSWVTPFTLAGLVAGTHSITVTKSGFVSDTKSVEVVSGSKSFVVAHLNAMTATLSVSSTPPGANVYIDGKDSGKLTPAQISIDKGQHVILVRKDGFIDETSNSQFVLGQTITFSPTLRSLGNVDDIKTTGKFKKLFGGKDAQAMGSVSVKTQPKGAQVAVNQHMLDKTSPVEFILDPGNYIVDITMSGYAPIHKVITVDKGGKAVIDEVLQRQ